MNLDDIKKKYTKEEIEKIKEDAEEVNFCVGTDLRHAVLYLENRRRNGDIYLYTNFNGKKLYSIDVTMNNAYKKCVGVTRKTWLKREKRRSIESYEREQNQIKEAQNKFSSWLKQGEKYIYPQRFGEWKTSCHSSIYDMFHGAEIDNALEIMKYLDEKSSLKEAKNALKRQKHSEFSYYTTLNLVVEFSKRGPAFYNYLNRNMDKLSKKYINKMKELNRRLKNGEDYMSVCNDLKEHKILDICIRNKDNKTLYEGSILVNDDSTFEGYLKHDTYAKGKLLGDDIISFAVFCNYKKLQQFTAVKQGHKFIGKKYIYFIDGISKGTEVSIDLKESNKDFRMENNIERSIEKEKERFDDDVKDMHYWYSYNMDRETSKMLNRYKKDLLIKFRDCLKSQIDEIKISPMSVPYNTPYMVTEAELQKIKNTKVDENIANSIKENAEKFEKNNVKINKKK